MGVIVITPPSPRKDGGVLRVSMALARSEEIIGNIVGVAALQVARMVGNTLSFKGGVAVIHPGAKDAAISPETVQILNERMNNTAKVSKRVRVSSRPPSLVQGVQRELMKR